MPTIVPIPRPDSPEAEPHPLLTPLHEAELEFERDAYGHTDFVDTLAARVVGLAGSPYVDNRTVLAVADGTDSDAPASDSVLAYCDMSFPLAEDLQNVMFHLAVRPSAPDPDALRADLLAVVEDEARRRDRSIFMTWAFYPGPLATGSNAIPAQSGTGAVDGTRAPSRFLTERGFVLEQAERQSVLRIPADREAFARRLTAMRDEAEAFAGEGYEVIRWVGPTPEDLLDDMAVLRSRMSTDAPVAGLAFEEADWDAERVRVGDRRSAARQQDWVTTVVRHTPSGLLAGYTDLYWHRDRPEGVFQEDTLVRSDHRGHRLGMLIKAANLLALLDENPHGDRVHTWNAAENEYMLSINEALGFEINGFEGAWQRRG